MVADDLITAEMTEQLKRALKDVMARGIAEGRRLQHEADVAAFGGDSYKAWWQTHADMGYLDGYHRFLAIDRLKATAP